jgi:hypothetical protein
VLAERRRDAPGDVAAVERLDRLRLGESLKQVGQVGVAVGASSRQGLPLTRQELGRRRILAELRVRAPDRPRQAGANGEAFAGVGNRRPGHLSERPRAVLVERQLEAGQCAWHAGGPPAEAVDLALDATLGVDGEDVFARRLRGGRVEVDGDNALSAGRGDDEVPPIAADAALLDRDDAGRQRGRHCRVDRVAAACQHIMADAGRFRRSCHAPLALCRSPPACSGEAAHIPSDTCHKETTSEPQYLPTILEMRHHSPVLVGQVGNLFCTPSQPTPGSIRALSGLAADW